MLARRYVNQKIVELRFLDEFSPLCPQENIAFMNSFATSGRT